MRKADIKQGEEYYVAQGRSYLYGERHVRVVNEELHITVNTNRAPIHALFKLSLPLVAAHEAYALTLAYPDDTTPKDAQTAKQRYLNVLDETRRAWFEADPLRAYAPGKYGSSYSPAGVLVQYIDRDGTAKGYGTEPRPRFRSTWAERVSDLEARKVYAAKAEMEAAKAKAEAVAARAKLVDMLTRIGMVNRDSNYDIFELPGTEVSFYLPDGKYRSDWWLTLSFDTLLALLQASAGTEVSA